MLSRCLWRLSTLSPTYERIFLILIRGISFPAFTHAFQLIIVLLLCSFNLFFRPHCQ